MSTFLFGVAAIVAGLALANRPALTGWLARSAEATEDRVGRGPVAERLRARQPAVEARQRSAAAR